MSSVVLMRNSFFLFLVLAFTLAKAQTKISGVVTDIDGNSVPFANVVFKNSFEGTITNEDGRFYLESNETYPQIVVSFLGFQNKEITLEKKINYNMSIVLQQEAASLDEVVIFSGKTSKKNNPAIDILKKIWDNRRQNGVKKFNQYAYDKYEKLEFDLNTIDSTFTENKIFKGMEFIFQEIDTSRVTGKTYLPIFINEASSKVYGDNLLGKEREILQGNKNSGFENNNTLIAFLKDLYSPYDVYDNYLKFFDKAFTSPLSKTGVDVYNYVLLDSAYRKDKWCYNIAYYPRRKNELTFKGDFWVNDSTWAIKEINLQASKSANVNWIREVYIEQEFDVLNDSIFLITRDYFMSDFSFQDKEKAKGVYGRRTTLYDNYVFDTPKEKYFYKIQVDPYQYEVYNRPDSFWEENRLEKLNKDELSIYKMLDTLKTVPRFKALYSAASVLASGYYEVDNFDIGPVFSVFGYNEAEGLRVRLGGRTYFSQNDQWRLEGFGAYGFKDDRFKFGISAKALLNRKNRLTLYAGYRKDVEQTGASLTSSNDVLGRNLASSSLITVGANDKLTRVKLATLGFSLEPVKNLNIRLTGSYRSLSSATQTFSVAYEREDGSIGNTVNQPELQVSAFFTPKRKVSGYGVERTIINQGSFPSIFLGYTYGIKGFLDGEFEYQRIQGLYSHPWNIGGIGRLTSTIEAGKTIGQVNLSLLNPIPGNQTLFSIYNTFSQIDFYEFVSDQYVSLHLKHNFGGRIFQRIPWLRDLNLREVLGFRAVIGSVNQENIDINKSNIVYQSPNKPYYEYSVGVGNIFKVFRLDVNFRGNYLNESEYPNARKFGFTGTFGFNF
ncbi:MAG: TonB-dependent receptor SusC [Flavobacteriaceae bacterium]|nr:MAG: TonB-dependent receptor SusC [Flavobacteriaceae bacterium]